MTKERVETLFNTLFTDKAATEAALKMTPEQVQAVLKEKGQDYTIDEIKEMGTELNALAEKIKAAVDANGGELTPELLEQVAGGMSTESIVVLSVFATMLGGLAIYCFGAAFFAW